MAIDWDGLLDAPLAAIFGEVVQYGRPDQPSFDLVAIHDRFQDEAELEAPAVRVSSHKILLGVRVGAFPPGFEPQQGDEVLARGILYEVVDVRDDAVGGITLELAKR